MRNTLLSMMTGGIFDGFLAPDEVSHLPENRTVESPVMMQEDRSKKRVRDGEEIAGSRTPTLMASRQEDVEDRAPKRRRGQFSTIPVPMPNMEDSSNNNPQLQSDFLRILPEEVVGHVLSFVGSTSDRFALQTTCSQLRRVSNADHMLKDVKLGGDLENGKGGIITDDDTPESASEALQPFARAGNLEAIYMLGMIKCYCHLDIERGIFLLKTASKRGCVRSAYTLGLILRDTDPEEATNQMNIAAKAGYLPALQELLPAREMKAKYGEPDAAALKNHLDPYCLNRLLGRHYLECSHLRDVNTSHCWNPLCGRWAYKASSSHANAARGPRAFPLAIVHHRLQDHGGRGPFPPRNGGVESPSRAARRSTSRERASQRRGGGSVSSNQAFAGQGVQEMMGLRHGNVGGGAGDSHLDVRVSRMKMCSRCCRAKYCSKLCQVYDWRSGRHKMECQFL